MANLDQIMNHIADNCIVEQGTSGIWKYRKYSDGTYHAWYEGTVSIESGASWGSGFYYHAASVVTAPLFSNSITSFTAAPIAGQFNMYCGCGQPDTSSRKPYLVNTSPSSSSNVTVRYDMYGTY